jgi:hypothetical protein
MTVKFLVVVVVVHSQIGSDDSKICNLILTSTDPSPFTLDDLLRYLDFSSDRMAHPRSRFGTRARRGGSNAGRSNHNSSTRDSSVLHRDATPISVASTANPSRHKQPSSLNLSLPAHPSSSNSLTGRPFPENANTDHVGSRSALNTTSNSRYFSTNTTASTGNLRPSTNQPHNRSSTTKQLAANGEPTSTSSIVYPMLNFDTSDESENEIIMALDVRTQATIGCAYYVARQEKIYFMQDCKYGDNSIIDTRKFSNPLRFCAHIF